MEEKISTNSLTIAPVQRSVSISIVARNLPIKEKDAQHMLHVGRLGLSQ